MPGVPFLLLYNISHMRICTWNSRGDKFNDNYVRSLLQEKGIDILCLQECGNLARYFNENIKSYDINYYKEHIWYEYLLIYHVWNVGGRCDMAVLVKQNIAISNIYINKAQILYDNNGEERNNMPLYTEKDLIRAMMTIELKDGYTINNVHLPSGKPAFARKVGYRLFCNYQCRNIANMFTLGDFNTPPNSWILLSPFKISHTNINTHTSGNIYDYMIYTNSQNYVANRHENNYGSDHYPVYFDI